MSGEVTRFLRDDAGHVRDALRRTTALIGPFDRWPFDEWAFEEFRFGMLRHMDRVARVVLPALAATRGVPAALADELRVVRAAMVSMLAPMPTLPRIAEIRTLLDIYGRLEEAGAGGLFAACDELPASSDQSLLVQLRWFPDPVPVEHCDAPGSPGTAEEALAVARRRLMRKPTDGVDAPAQPPHTLLPADREAQDGAHSGAPVRKAA